MNANLQNVLAAHGSGSLVRGGAHAGVFSASSGQMAIQSFGLSSCRVTSRPVFCSMATHTFSAKSLYPYETFVRCPAVVPTDAAKAMRPSGVSFDR